MNKKTRRPKKSVDNERRYEASGKRPGTPVSTRLSDSEIKLLDSRRRKLSRSAWLLTLIRRDLGVNER